MSSTEGIYKKYYSDDGKLIREGELLNGRRIGNWKFYYDTGELSMEGQYGFYSQIKDYAKYGQIKEWKYYSKSGEIDVIIKYKNGQKNVEILCKYELDEHTSEIRYKWEFIFLKGKLIYCKKYWKHSFDKFKYSLAETYQMGGDKMRHGLFKEKVCGRLWSMGFYLNNELNGPFKKYKEYYEYWDNVDYWDGPHKIKFHHLYKEGNYVDGKKHGIWKKYYYDGKIKCEVNYINGEKNGPFIEYFKNGKINRTGHYLNDRCYDMWITFDISGRITQKYFYGNQKTTKKWKAKYEYFD